MPQTIYGGGLGIPRGEIRSSSLGRYPANVVHDGSEEVLEEFAAFGEAGGGFGVRGSDAGNTMYGGGKDLCRQTVGQIVGFGDAGTAARFFYCAKASKTERGKGNHHPTIKPLKLCEWLVKLVCPEGATVLDPFMGSGTTGVACVQTGRKFIGIELDAGYFKIAQERIAAAQAELPLFEGV